MVNNINMILGKWGSEDVQLNELDCSHWRDQAQHIYTLVKEKHCGHINTQEMASNTHQLI